MKKKENKKMPKFASYAEEAEHIVNRLMNSEKYCYQFFFLNVPGEYSIAPIMDFVIDCILYSYGIEISRADFATIMYEKLWDYGTWNPLKSVSGEYSFFTWLYTVAFRTMSLWVTSRSSVSALRRTR